MKRKARARRPFVAMVMIGLLFTMTHGRGAQSDRASTAQILWQFEAGG